MTKPDTTIETHDVKAVNATTERALYKKRDPIYPKAVSGRWRTIKWAAMIVLLGIYYGVPWLRWDRGEGFPDQAVLVDFAGRRFYFFWIELWPQEMFYITGLLILAGLGLFLATSLFGRIWCGYACPQTVWTDLFIAVEHRIEGDRNARMRLDKAPWSLDKVRKKTTKHIIWLIIAFATGGAWILYFHDAPTIARDFFTGYAPVTSYVFAFLLTFTTYTLAGAMREQVCTYMCPWPRIQGAMTDNESLSVTYRTDRGEPRGTHKKTETWEGRGDCVDCKACVAACPMGIDIRDGLQFECINCALCIDACDDIMDKIGRPRGLIAYDTDANIIRRTEGRPPRFRFVRTRTIFYAVVFALVGLVMLYVLMHRSTLDLNVIRDRSPNFVRLSDGAIRNSYTIKAINKERAPRLLELEVKGMDGLEVVGLGTSTAGTAPRFQVPGDRVRAVRIFVKAPATTGTHDLTFILRDPTTGQEELSKATFAGPAS